MCVCVCVCGWNMCVCAADRVALTISPVRRDARYKTQKRRLEDSMEVRANNNKKRWKWDKILARKKPGPNTVRGGQERRWREMIKMVKIVQTKPKMKAGECGLAHLSIGVIRRLESEVRDAHLLEEHAHEACKDTDGDHIRTTNTTDGTRQSSLETARVGSCEVRSGQEEAGDTDAEID